MAPAVNTTGTNTTGTRKPKTKGMGLLGGKKDSGPKSADQMKFTPINIRDPMNLRRFR